MALSETTGERIARLRKAKKIRQYKLAGMIGIHPSSLNQIETDKRKPSQSTVSGLAKVLEVSRDLILDGEKEPSGQNHEHQGQQFTDFQLNTAVREAIKGMLSDIINAVSIAIASPQLSETAQRKSDRSKPDKRRTGSH